MINIAVQIERIDYEKSIDRLLPRVLNGEAGKKTAEEAAKFLEKLGPDAVPQYKFI